MLEKYNGCEHCEGYTEEFIRQAREVHGDKHDYSLTVILCPLCAPENWDRKEVARLMEFEKSKRAENGESK